MATSKDDILKAIEEMSVMDLVELISAIEEKFGVTAAAAVAAAPAAAAGDAGGDAAEEKDCTTQKNRTKKVGPSLLILRKLLTLRKSRRGHLKA